jgi:acetyltransferase-like isoleucine patch superfamily enzyme
MNLFNFRLLYNKIRLKKIGSIGLNSYISYKSTTYLPNLFVGNYVKAGSGCLFYTTKESKIYIGDGTIIAPKVTMFTTNHNYNKNPQAIPFDNINYVADIIIGKGVWIGENVYILPGVKIGDGAVIGCCSVVTKDIPESSICVGNPVKIIKNRDKTQFLNLLQNQQFYHSNNWRKGKKIFIKKT